MRERGRGDEERGTTAEFDERLRWCAFLFAALADVVAFIYAMLPLDQDVANERLLRVLALCALMVLALAIAVPWQRVTRNWFAVGSLIALPFIAAFVQVSGQWLSPLQAFYYLALVFHTTFYRRRIAFLLNVLTLLFSLTPVLFNHDLVEFVKRLVVNAAVFVALGLTIDAIVEVIRRQERRISGLTIERRGETERLAALQRATVLINSQLETREAMAALVHELSATLGYPFVTIYLDVGDGVPALVASAGYSVPLAPNPPDGSVVEHVFRSGAATIVRDVGAGAHGFRMAPEARSIISVPMHDADAVIGVITIEDIRALDPRDLELLELFAQQADTALGNAHRYAQERQHVAREEALREVALALTSTLDPAIVLRGVLDQLARVLPSDGAAVLTRDGSAGMRVAATRGKFATDDAPLKDFNPYRGSDAVATSLAGDAPLLPAYYVHEMPDLSPDTDAALPHWIGSLIAAPLLVDRGLRGVILVAAAQRGQYASADADLVADFARHAAVALHNAELHDALVRTARTDPLTGLLNHGALLETLAHEVSRSARYDHPLSVLFLDLDHFKAVNDTHGHQFGDEVLRVLARITREAVRHVDTIGRYGGEEFVVVLPETEYAQAMTVAERLRERVAAHPIGAPAPGAAISVTISIGVTTYPGDGRTVNDLVRTADGALYAAKRSGRNCVRGSRDFALAAD